MRIIWLRAMKKVSRKRVPVVSPAELFGALEARCLVYEEVAVEPINETRLPNTVKTIPFHAVFD